MGIEVKVKAIRFLEATGQKQIANILKEVEDDSDIICHVVYYYSPAYEGSIEEPPEEEEVHINFIEVDSIIYQCQDVEYLEEIVEQILEHEHSMKDWDIGGWYE